MKPAVVQVYIRAMILSKTLWVMFATPCTAVFVRRIEGSFKKLKAVYMTSLLWRTGHTLHKLSNQEQCVTNYLKNSSQPAHWSFESREELFAYVPTHPATLHRSNQFTTLPFYSSKTRPLMASSHLMPVRYLVELYL